MKKFLLMLLAVLFCTTAMCTSNVYAQVNTSEAADNSNEAVSNSKETKENSVQKTTQSGHAALFSKASKAFSEEEVYLCAQLVNHEAHNQSFDGKVGVAEVVLNRIRAAHFPNTIAEVINQNGQFTGVRRIKNIKPSSAELNIAEGVLNGNLRVFNDPTILYFRNPKVTSGISAQTDKDWGKLDYATYIGDHAFYSQRVPQRMLNALSAKDKLSDGKKDLADNSKEKQKSSVKANAEEDMLEDTVNVDSMIAMAQAQALSVIVAETEKKEEENEDPVAAIHKQLEIDRQNDLKNIAAMEAANAEANEAAKQQAEDCVKQAVDLQEVILQIGQTKVE